MEKQCGHCGTEVSEQDLAEAFKLEPDRVMVDGVLTDVTRTTSWMWFHKNTCGKFVRKKKEYAGEEWPNG